MTTDLVINYLILVSTLFSFLGFPFLDFAGLVYSITSRLSGVQFKARDNSVAYLANPLILVCETGQRWWWWDVFSMMIIILFCFLRVLTVFVFQTSAARAKKKGKLLHRNELLLLWQRKKQSKSDNLKTKLNWYRNNFYCIDITVC